MNYVIKNECYEAVVSDLGAELISVKNTKGFEFLWQNNADFWDSHAPILFPVCGRLKDKGYSYNGTKYEMNSHGFARDMIFTVIETTESSISLALASNEQTKKIYPFDFELIATYALVGDRLNFIFTVKNCDTGTLPYMFGWHPGFNLPTDDSIDINDYKLYLGVNKLAWCKLQNGPFASPDRTPYELTSGFYPLSEREIYDNDTMIFEGHNNFANLSAGGSFSVLMDWSDNLPELCIWKENSSDAKFLCIEPWTSLPGDGVTDEDFNTRAMPRLAPNESETFTYSLKMKA